MQATRDTQKQHHQRLSDLESQIDLLKKMNRPAGSEDTGPDLLDALQDIQDKLRAEFDQKLNDLRDELMAKIKALEEKDKDQQEQIDNLTRLFDKHQQQLDDIMLQLE